MMDKDCLQCGEPGKHTHPGFAGDKMCDPCYLAYCEEEVERTIEQLLLAEIKTGLRSDMDHIRKGVE